MHFSVDWLSQYVDLPGDVEELARALTAGGLTVEGIERRGEDVVLDVDVTTNRSDCMNHLGVAREIAVLFDRSLRRPEVELLELSEPAADAIRIEVEDRDGCPRYIGRVVRGVAVGPSPEWLVKRLEAIDLRSINNVVDITNFVLWETGQPLHAFDLAKVGGGLIRVRRARPGEVLVTLDGEERKLDPDILVIADGERAVALAGIMGGMESEVGAATTDILIESAHFDPRLVRAGAKRLGLSTDASYRFERGADPEACRAAADRAAALIAEVAGGRVLAGAVDVRGESLQWLLQGRLDPQRLAAFAGAGISGADARRWLEGLGFEVEAEEEGEGKALRVTAPTWRYYDLKPRPGGPKGRDSEPIFEADLFEEVMRIYGYGPIPSTLPKGAEPDAGSSRDHLGRERLRGHLAACGYAETINYAFHDEASDRRFSGLQPGGEPLKLANPLSDLYTLMRRSLLPGLVQGALYNQRRGAEAVRLFEIGHVFPARGEELEVVGVVCGGWLGTPWERRRQLDLFDLKGVVESLAGLCGGGIEARAAEIKGFVAGTGAEISRRGVPGRIGVIGQVDEEAAGFPLFAAELLRAGLEQSLEERKVRLPSRYPGVSADITLTHSRDLAWAEIKAAVEEMKVPELVDFRLKDRYTGSGVPEGAVNSTLGLRFGADDRSLKQEEVNQRLGDMIRRLEERFGWKD